MGIVAGEAGFAVFAWVRCEIGVAPVARPSPGLSLVRPLQLLRSDSPPIFFERNPAVLSSPPVHRSKEMKCGIFCRFAVGGDCST